MIVVGVAVLRARLAPSLPTALFRDRPFLVRGSAMLRCAILRPLVVASLLIFTAAPGRAQLLPRPHLDWRTLKTEHFDIHYPASLAEWTHRVAARIESVHEEVVRFVGSAPVKRVTVVVDDPANVANGFAVPFLDAPLMYLFPTPPGPTTGIGHHRDWGELLVLHEYAHLAHMTRPTRNPTRRALWRLLPVQLGPIARRSPRWVTEGYATYLEGRLTGSGRPHGVARAAVLRQRALEGRLPTYSQLHTSRDFQGGAMAYLAGSAYLEWLVERRGEESLDHLWRRMSARRVRSFDDAFAGVFGGTPRDLYGRFTVELTARALAVEDTLRREGLETGDTVQRRSWHTGEPAISGDGALIAIVLGYRERPSRLVIWRTEEEPEDERTVRARERALQRDPQDVPAVEWRPRPKRAIATLFPKNGRPHLEPGFLPDGERVLVTRLEPVADGSLRPDLFIWNFRRGTLRRVTHGAAVRQADPAPDGLSALAIQCLSGSCSVVSVDLATGAVRVLAAGSPTRSFYRPRFSSDGTRIVVAVQQQGQWRLATADARGGTFTVIADTDGASRYDAAFVSDEALVAVSELGGIPNLERIALPTGVVTPLTRVTGAALGPEPHPVDGRIYFLHLHAQGMDLNRIHQDSVKLRATVVPDSAWAPAVPVAPTARAETLSVRPVPEPTDYGFGPRRHRVLLGGGIGGEGRYVSGALIGTDPVGRFSWVLQGAYGNPASWRGGALAAEWRRTRLVWGGDLFHLRHRPSEQRYTGLAPSSLDFSYSGLTLGGKQVTAHGTGTTRLLVGGSVGTLEGPALETATRILGFLEGDAQLRLFTRDRWSASTALAAHVTLGRTGDEADGWWRTIGSATLLLERGARGLHMTAALARVDPGALAFEQLAVGGVPVPLIDPAILSQHLSMPALPIGVLLGDEIVTVRGSLTGVLLQPYYWIARTGSDPRWHRVVGGETRAVLPSLPLIGFPAITATGGVGYSLDEPFRRRARGYLSITFRP